MAQPSPWKSLAEADPGKEYLFLLSYLPLGTARALPKFVRYTLGIRKQLETTPGAIGYSLKANLRARDFWTLSVWDGERPLAEFVRRNPHGDVMSALERDMGQATFVRWTALGSTLHPPGRTPSRAPATTRASSGAIRHTCRSVPPTWSPSASCAR